MGHLARLLEEAGLPTVIIAIRAFRDRLAGMRVPRLLTTPHPLGRPLGAPGDAATQRAVLTAALALLDKASASTTIEDFAGSYRPGSGAEPRD